jgi:signal transduction histidine kinase
MPHREAPELSELVMMMAHDLRNPLAALMTNLHFLQGAIAEPDQDALDALGDSVTLCEVMERFLRNLDLLARRKDASSRRQLVALGSIAHEAVSRVQSQAKAAGIDLRLNRGDASEISVFVDRDLFVRAVENAIANALENAPASSTVNVGLAGAEAEAAVVIDDGREVLPPWNAAEASPGPGVPSDSKRLQGLYGRGLALLCASLAAHATGARLEIDGGPRACRLRLVAPLRE